MKPILVSYGKFNGYQLCELPSEELRVLALRFPLNAENCIGREWEELLITVAVHEELKRREQGGEPQKKEPSVRELANQIVSKGFRESSKIHHPDRTGDNNMQRQLINARDRLLSLVEGIEPAYDEQDAFFVTAPPTPGTPEQTHRRSQDPFDISDNDVPF